jgi:hypothetical protein
MRKNLLSLMMMTLMTGMVPAWGAQATYVVPFQAAVAVKAGQPPLDANPYSVRLQLYPDAFSGGAVYSDTLPVFIRHGVLSVELGSGAVALDPNLFKNNPDLWLQVEVDFNRDTTFAADEKFDQRIHLGAAPYAMAARVALQADSATNATNAVTAQTATNATNATTAQTAINATNAVTAQTANSLKLTASLLDTGGNLVSQLSDSGGFYSLKNWGQGAPVRGAFHRDNAPIAWGYIGADGSLLAGFGIKSSSYSSSTKSYEIELYNDVATPGSQPAYSVSACSVEFKSSDTTYPWRPEVIVYEPRAANKIGLVVFALDAAEVQTDYSVYFPRETSAFSVTVFGRPN